MSFWKSMKSLGNLMIGSNKYDGKNNYDSSMGPFYDLKDVKDIDACKCGYTQGSYDAMEKLMIKYEDKGLRMLCFPCNQFMGQEPWTEQEIKKWVTGKWPKLNPTMFSKIEVNGDNVDKTYKYLKTVFPGDINWNFATKFLVGKDGIPINRFDKNQTWEEIEEVIKTALDKEYQNDKNEENVEKKDNADDNTNDNDNDNDKDNVDKAPSEEQKEDENDKSAFDAKEYVESTISSGPIVMISKSYCPFCKKAFEILSKYTKDIIKKEIDIDFKEKDMNAIQEYCKERTGASSVPRVFIDGKCIGGGDDTEKLDKENKLKEMIEAAINK